MVSGGIRSRQVASVGVRWSVLLSGGVCWCQVEGAGLRWNLVVFGGVRFVVPFTIGSHPSGLGMFRCRTTRTESSYVIYSY